MNYDLFVLKSGVVRIEVDTEKTFEILDKKGMFFGEVAAVEKVPRLENVYADTDVDLYALNSALFFGFLKKFPLMGERTKRASNRVQNFIRLKEAKQVGNLSSRLIFSIKNSTHLSHPLLYRRHFLLS